MLAVSILWIIVGLLYVVYRLFRDGDEQSLSIALTIVLFPVFLFLLAYAWKFMLIILCVFGSTALIVYRRRKKNGYYNPEEIQKRASDSRSKRIDKWYKFMSEHYPNIRKDDIVLLLDDPCSPLNNSTNKLQAGYLYMWICEYRTQELSKLSDEELKKYIGDVPINEIPIDENISIYRAQEKRRILIIDKILKEQYGLKYVGFLKKPNPYSINDDYAKCVYDFIDGYKDKYMTVNKKGNTVILDKKEECRKLFEKHGYTSIRDEDLETLITSCFSPLNLAYDGKRIRSAVQFEELYGWLCAELSKKLVWLSEEELGIYLGVPLSVIPIDSTLENREAISARKFLCIDIILRDKHGGLEYRSPFEDRPNDLYRNDYRTEVEQFIKNYNSEHH